MDDTLLFSKKVPALNNKNDKIRFVEISREYEKDFKLMEIVEKIKNDVKTSYTLYLMKSSRPDWKFLNDLHELDFGCTMTSEGIERANKRAFKTENCQLTEIDIEKDITVEFNSKDDWIMKNNLFFIPDMNVQYFAELGKKYENKELESFENKFRVIEKASFKICNLKATEDFIEKVNEAIELGDPKKFKQITEEFGQFIPTEIIFGHHVQGVTADQTNDEKKLLDDYEHWDIIEFRNPISVFELIDDSLDNKLRKDVYSFFGKRILHTEIQGLVRDSEVETEIVDLPRTISKFISNKQADCSIFATVVGMKDYYHCQILTSPGNEPKLMIHCFKENSKDCELVIGWMVIGYDTNFKSIFSDCNTRLDDDTRFEILKKDYNPSEEKNNIGEFDLNSSTESPYYIGIPVIDKSNLVIGHYFSNNSEKLYTFAYSLKDKKQVELPKFSFNILEITNYNNSLMVFEKNMNNNIIDFDKHDEFKKLKNIPKFVSLYSNKNKNGQILLKQRFTKIKVKSLDKKLSDDDVLKCSFFIPFESNQLHLSYLNSNTGFFKLPKRSRSDTKEIPFSKFSSLLDDVEKISEEIVKSIQPMENNKEILEQFKRRALEAGKIVKHLKAYRYQYVHFFNHDNLILLKNLDENIKKIEMFVKRIGQFKEINQSRISRISNIKKLYDARKIRESFDNNLDKVQKSMGSSKEQTIHYNEDLIDNELPTIPTTPSAKIEISETDISNTGISSTHDNKNGGVATKITSNTAITVAAETTTTSPKTGGETTSIAIETEIDSEQEETSIGNESNEIVDGDKIILQDGKMVKTRTPTKRSKTFSNSEMDKNGIVTVTKTDIKTNENGNTNVTVTITKKKIPMENFLPQMLYLSRRKTLNP
ncbi:hypothetical protein C1645_739029 [Glomus cerebriforme]|uniref:DUF7431 domain-containing protein n=1 Tax=Glomus cerebriforme TaxID=658196 RepID=A0A397SY85_9GLOM|nr:hypothetical protein C1645_739029 [Glomus cerebriforme]